MTGQEQTSHFDDDSVGIVEQKEQEFGPLELVEGGTIERYRLKYETYGELNGKGDNAILVCHSLTANHHAAGRYKKEDVLPGWWEAMIGPGKMLDTNHWYVVCVSNLGGV